MVFSNQIVPDPSSPPFFFPGIPTAQIHSIIERHMHFDPGKKPEQRLFSMWPKVSKWTEDTLMSSSLFPLLHCLGGGLLITFPHYPVSIWSLNVWQQFADDDLVWQLWRATVRAYLAFAFPSTWFCSRFPGTNTYSCKHGLPANTILHLQWSCSCLGQYLQSYLWDIIGHRFHSFIMIQSKSPLGPLRPPGCKNCCIA